MLKILTYLLIIPIFIINCNSMLLKKSQPETLEEYINYLGKDITRTDTGIEIKKIAVLEFYDSEGNSTQLSRIIAEELTLQLFNTKKFSVIERQLLNRVIEEQKLSLSGKLHEQSVKSIGKILGVDAILTGTYNYFGDHVNLYGRLISTETGEIFSVSKVQVPQNLIISLINDKGTTMVGEKDSPIQKIQRNDLIYELCNVEYSNDQVLCEMKVTSKNEDRIVVFFGRNTITTSNGKVYKNSFRSIGDQKTTYISSVIRFKLFKNVPYTYVLKFDKIYETPEKISVLELEIKDDQTREFIQFRNITL